MNPSANASPNPGAGWFDDSSKVVRPVPDSLTIDALKQQALARGLRWVEVPANTTLVQQDRASLLHAMAQAMNFPAHFGGNLDALFDCLSEITQTPDFSGMMVLLHGAQGIEARDPEFWSALVETLEDVAAACTERGAWFQVLLK